MKVCDRDVKISGRLIRIARLDAEKYQFPENQEQIIDALRKSPVRIDLFTFMQKVSETAPRFSYPMEWDNFAALPVSTFDHWWAKQIDSKTRNMVRKGEKKGVTLREVPFGDTLVHGIWEVYNECPIRQGKPFAHYGKDIETVRKEAATFLDHSIFIGAFLDEKMIGFVKLVTNETQTQAGLMHIISMIQHRDKAPTNALIAQSVRSCAERGIGHLVYSHFVYRNKQRDDLSDFKEHNGFQKIDVPRYHVPMTPIGWAAIRLGLHHSFTDRLPEPLLARARKLRNAWYNRKFQVAREAS